MATYVSHVPAGMPEGGLTGPLDASGALHHKMSVPRSAAPLCALPHHNCWLLSTEKAVLLLMTILTTNAPYESEQVLLALG